MESREEEGYLIGRNCIISAQVYEHWQITCRKAMKSIPALGNL